MALKGESELKVATLYAALERLEREGLVAVDGDEAVDGRLRRYFRLTDLARKLCGRRLSGSKRTRGTRGRACIAATDHGIVIEHMIVERDEMTMVGDRSSEYRRLLRWYPACWRAQHEEVVVAILLDQADARGDTVPTMSDRFTMAIGGLRQRFGASSGRPSSVIVPLAAATAFSLFYFSVIAWSPGIRYPGAVGPFTNPSSLWPSSSSPR